MKLFATGVGHTVAITTTILATKNIIDNLVATSLYDHIPLLTFEIDSWEKISKDVEKVGEVVLAIHVVKLCNKRKIANGWVDMSVLDRLIRVPPFGLCMNFN